MPPKSILIAGAGALGSALAVVLTRAGARVTLAAPAPIGANASGIAAGMLAPVFESLFDAGAEALETFRRARDAWPAFAARIGIDLDRTGAMAVGSAGELDDWQAQLYAWGVAATRLTPAEARTRAPWLAGERGGLYTDEDWRLDAGSALAALREAADREGVRRLDAGVVGFDAGRATLTNGEILDADALVVATGASRALIDVAPELTGLAPIKGHILRAPGLILTGPVARFDGGYICPAPGGAIIGASMEIGRDDAVVDPGSVQRVRDLAARVLPAIASTPFTAAAGVRADTPDHRPLVGRSAAVGVWLAVGARRNGWLLAPMIAEAIAREVMGGAGEGVFDPGRFAGE